VRFNKRNKRLKIKWISQYMYDDDEYISEEDLKKIKEYFPNDIFDEEELIKKVKEFFGKLSERGIDVKYGFSFNNDSNSIAY